jgi:hypothetical protein
MSISRRTFLGETLSWAAFTLAGRGESNAPAPPSAASKPSVAGSATSKPAASVAPSAKASAPRTATAVKAAWVAITANQMLWPLALEAGYFDKYGVNLSLQYVQGSLTSVAAQASETNLVMTGRLTEPGRRASPAWTSSRARRWQCPRSATPTTSPWPILTQHQTPYPTKDGFASVIKEVATQRPTASSATPDQCIDNSLVKELSDSGFIKQIYGH